MNHSNRNCSSNWWLGCNVTPNWNSCFLTFLKLSSRKPYQNRVSQTWNFTLRRWSIGFTKWRFTGMWYNQHHVVCLLSVGVSLQMEIYYFSISDCVCHVDHFIVSWDLCILCHFIFSYRLSEWISFYGHISKLSFMHHLQPDTVFGQNRLINPRAILNNLWFEIKICK